MKTVPALPEVNIKTSLTSLVMIRFKTDLSNQFRPGLEEATATIMPAELDSLQIDDDSVAGYTPAGSETPEDVFLQIWNEAVKHCMEGLSDIDRVNISRFETPQQLLDSLKEQEEKEAKEWYSKVRAEVRPALDVLKDASHMFAVAMAPRSLELTCFWGFLHLAISLSLKTEDRWKTIAPTLRTIKWTLLKCQRYATKSQRNSNLRHHLIDVFVNLIQFWKEVCGYLRNHPSVSKMIFTDYLRATFERSKLRIDEAVDNLQQTFETDDGQDAETLVEQKSVYEQTFPCRLLPRLNRGLYVPRDELLKNMQKLLEKYDELWIWGVAGTGKSTVALAYATDTENYDYVLWIKAESSMSVLESFTNIARSLGLETGRGQEANRKAVLTHLSESGRKWLLVFDNVENRESLDGSRPPDEHGRGAYLMTTRYENLADNERRGDSATKKIRSMSRDESWQLFGECMQQADRNGWNDLSRVQEDEAEAARALLDHLDGLPLGIRHIAGIIKVQKISVAKFLRKYDLAAGDTRLLLSRRPGAVLDNDYPHGLDTVWKLSFKELQKSGMENASNLLSVLCLLSPNGTSAELLEQVDGDQPTCLDFCQHVGQFDEAKEVLREAALIDIDDDIFELHRLTQTAYLNYISDEELQNAFDAASILLCHIFPKQIMGRPLFRHWETCKNYIQHAISLCRRYEMLKQARNLKVPPAFTSLWASCSWYLVEIGDHTQNLALIPTVKKACTDNENYVYSNILNSEAASEFEMDQTKSAIRTWNECLAIRRKFMDPKDEDLMNTINNLGNSETSEDRWETALQHFNEAKEVREMLGEETRVSLALTYAGMGRVFLGQKNFADADFYLSKAHDLAVERNGPQGIFVSDFLYTRGNISYAQRDWETAFHFYEDALAVEREQKRDHSNMAVSCLYKLGCVTLAQNNASQACRTLQEALDIALATSHTGQVSRISWKLSQALNYGLVNEGLGHDPERAKEIERLSKDARIRRSKHERETGCAKQSDDEETAYNRLVCLFLR